MADLAGYWLEYCKLYMDGTFLARCVEFREEERRLAWSAANEFERDNYAEVALAVQVTRCEVEMSQRGAECAILRNDMSYSSSNFDSHTALETLRYLRGDRGAYRCSLQTAGDLLRNNCKKPGCLLPTAVNYKQDAVELISRRHPESSFAEVSNDANDDINGLCTVVACPGLLPTIASLAPETRNGGFCPRTTHGSLCRGKCRCASDESNFDFL